MPSHKVDRATEDIRRELTSIMRGVKDPRVNGMISIVSIDLTNDYSHCTVYISSLEGLDAAKEAAKGLTSAAGYIRRELGSTLRLRRMPELHFVPDDGIAHSADIGRILNTLKKDEPKDEN